MRAWTIVEPIGPKGLSLVERPKPEPGPGEAVVRMHAASLNYRDLQIVEGRYPRTPKLLPDLVPLSDGAGEVEAVGVGVSGLARGDRVAANLVQDWQCGRLTPRIAASTIGAHRHGVLAEYVAFPVSSLVVLPDHLHFMEGATLPCAGLTAWHAVMAAGLAKPGETVLVQGSGGVSLFAAQFALAVGARVIGTSGHAEKRARMREMGCAEVFDYRTNPAWGQQVLELTGGEGADLIVEVGGAGTLQQSLAAVAVGGRISLVGTLAQPAMIDPRPILVRYASITAILAGSCEMFREMNAFLANERLRPVIDRVFAFEHAPIAYDYLARQDHMGKVVIAIKPSPMSRVAHLRNPGSQFASEIVPLFPRLSPRSSLV